MMSEGELCEVANVLDVDINNVEGETEADLHAERELAFGDDSGDRLKPELVTTSRA